MLNQDKIKVIEKLSDDVGLYFHDINVTDNNLVADSHFLRFEFGPNHVTVSDRYTLPGPDLKKYLLENLPYKLEYTNQHFVEVLIDDIDNIHSNLIALEILEEEREE